LNCGNDVSIYSSCDKEIIDIFKQLTTFPSKQLKLNLKKESKTKTLFCTPRPADNSEDVALYLTKDFNIPLIALGGRTLTLKNVCGELPPKTSKTWTNNLSIGAIISLPHSISSTISISLTNT